jgi:hypothetical protein
VQISSPYYEQCKGNNRFSKHVENFKYLGMTEMNQNCSRKKRPFEISGSHSGKYEVQSLLGCIAV